MRTLASLTLLLCLVSLGCGKEKNSPPKGEPKRVVTLTPSATDLVVALGDVHKIVGRDRYSTQPSALEQVPVVGDFVSPNVEAIAALAPDLVVLDQAQARVRGSLEALDIPTLAIEMHNLEDLRGGIEAVGAALHRGAKARDLVQRINGALQETADQAAQRSQHPRVLLIIDRAPDELRDLVAAGPGSYLDELLVLTGAVNLMAGAKTRYPKLALEHILRSRPDIIIDVSHTGTASSGLERWKELSELEVYKAKRIHTINDRRLLSPSTELAAALEQLMAITAMDHGL